ncbi:fibrous sheath CABYR-binding protein isoform X2 [Sitophilus oryzae]|uniref:Fibrous sheath CABYR-binding protein isoform X2 n=1 Tax=Sitophilus oryzae TaxID=7048 RepID=A0A6J2XPI6_SITOR|nr:fibrous sheath CABYR-binding protein isoform X2 [Sitophilus oryzae]
MEDNEELQKGSKENVPKPEASAEAPGVPDEKSTEIKQNESREVPEAEEPHPPTKETSREVPQMTEIDPEPTAEPEALPAEPVPELPIEERPKAVSLDDPSAPQEERRSSKRMSTEKGQELFIPPGGRDRRSTDIGAVESKYGFAKAAKLFAAPKGKGLGSVLDIKSNVADAYDKKSTRYQNTYRLESENPFNPQKVDKILKDVMEEALNNLQYDPDKCPSQAKWAVTQIRTKVKQLDFDRFLWDAEKDRYAYYSLENTYVYGIAYCFGLYYE